MKQHIYAAFVCLILTGTLHAKENVNVHKTAPPDPTIPLSGCAPSKSRADLDINNVRTPIWINGDMWWDLVGNALYEVPVGSGKHSLFAGAIWIGGKDPSGQLKVAAQTYRQSGNDFWPGPIDKSTVTITPGQCLYYDHHYKITFAEVKAFHEQYQVNLNLNYPVPDVIKNWPGNGNANYHEDSPLAPFFDRNADGIYDYTDGDYPKYNVDGSLDACDKNLLLGDQTIWWVFNDVGDNHSETGSTGSSPNKIGIEIQAQAFGFNTNDEINNMTFYRYKIINRAFTILNETYFGSWVDPDLGNYLDDYVGCDVARGLGYCYNGDADDDGALGYGLNPPAIGLDFFEGPVADSADGLDNNRNGVIDEPGEQIIMSKFVYYNNDFSTIGNPSNAQHYYNYLDGKWKDATALQYGGDGHSSTTGIACNFMFPGDSDPNHIGTAGTDPGFEWSETHPTQSGPPNVPSDRRFLQSAGKFTLKPGDVNFITTGAVWARASSGGPEASVKLLKIADVKAQNLFEACFKLMDGPDAPDLTIRELDKEVIISLTNSGELGNRSNNYKEEYSEKDINIPLDTDAVFVFEGYKVFQVKDPSVSVNDLFNADKARLVFQCDIQNGVSQIVNQVLDPNQNAFVPTTEVNGADKGLHHSFKITTDAFASGNTTMINHKTYYFLAVAYAYDPKSDVDPRDPGTNIPGIYGQPYIQSRKNADGTSISIYSAIPHIPDPEANGLVLNTAFDDGPEITRITGIGNGFIRGSERQTIDLKQEQIESILFNQSNSTNRVLYPTYQRAKGPVDIRIYDPVRVPSAEFELWLPDTTSSSRWLLRNKNTGQVDTSEKTIENPYDELFPEYGFYINLNQVKAPGQYPPGGNGAIEGTLEFSNPAYQWLNFIPDIDNFATFNWILSGNNTDPTIYDSPDYEGLDGSQFYEKILGGTWAPFILCSRNSTGVDFISPAPFLGGGQHPQDLDSLWYLGSVDIVFTSDKSKWSRCVVFEMDNITDSAEGGEGKNLIRKHPSMNLDGTYSTTDSGFSYFPGYAINVETGERLNIAFGEDSRLIYDNGNDMKWNPSSRAVEFLDIDSVNLYAAGKHYIYVFGHKNPETPNQSQDTSYYGPAYDGCQHIYSKLWGLPPLLNTSQSRNRMKYVWKDCMWVGCPILTPGQALLSTDARVRLRVSKPYRRYDTGTSSSNNNSPFYNFNTFDLTAKVNQIEVAKNALSLINIVPNPYYAYSNYENNQLDNRVKIVNLPPNCQVSIYTTSGALIRRYNRDAGNPNNGNYNTSGANYPEVNLESSIDWDLKNSLGIPVASGIYLIHIKADGVGERTLKWFGVMRPIDLDTF